MMIHFSCPCCEVSRLPHTDECTFRKDWPEGCADFDYIASLRSDLEAALAEVERHKMTAEEDGVYKTSRLFLDGLPVTGIACWDGGERGGTRTKEDK
jgi:hypothetical protein